LRKIVASVFATLIALIAVIVLWPAPDQGLVLYSGLDYGPAVADTFTRETGIKIRVVRLDTGSLLARMTAQSQHPDWDIAWFDGATAAASLDGAGLLAHNLPAPQRLTTAGRSLVSTNGSYIPTGYTLAGVFISDPARLHTPPTDWQGLIAPGLRNLVGMNDPSISGPTFPMLAGMLDQAGGWPQGQGFVTALKANGLQMFDKNDATLAALQAQAIGLAIVQSSAAVFFVAHHPAFHITFPNPAFMLPNVMVEAAGLPARKRDAAVRFMAFVMRPDIQKLRQADGEADGEYWPVTDDVSTLPEVPNVSCFHIVTLDPVHWGRLENAINGWFASVMTGT
jgi:iron(III) transport system substrate-binding protein